jgi:hypothetical protein
MMILRDRFHDPARLRADVWAAARSTAFGDALQATDTPVNMDQMISWALLRTQLVSD